MEGDSALPCLPFPLCISSCELAKPASSLLLPIASVLIHVSCLECLCIPFRVSVFSHDSRLQPRSTLAPSSRRSVVAQVPRFSHMAAENGGTRVGDQLTTRSQLVDRTIVCAIVQDKAHAMLLIGDDWARS
jgi:hypothetical protein